MQQGDQASTLMFSLVEHPTAKEIAERTQLSLHRWYADDFTLIGTHSELGKAVEILWFKGSDHGLFRRERVYFSRVTLSTGHCRY